MSNFYSLAYRRSLDPSSLGLIHPYSFRHLLPFLWQATFFVFYSTPSSVLINSFVCWSHLQEPKDKQRWISLAVSMHKLPPFLLLLIFKNVFIKKKNKFLLSGVALNWLSAQWIETLPCSLQCPGTELNSSIQALLLNVPHSVVLANRSFQGSSLSPIAASLMLFPVVEDRSALVLFQRDSVTNVLRR